jgi:hypothetical protein
MICLFFDLSRAVDRVNDYAYERCFRNHQRRHSDHGAGSNYVRVFVQMRVLVLTARFTLR